MSKYGDVIRQARQQESQKDGINENQLTEKQENQKTSGMGDKQEEVNLSIKVTKTMRRHWASEAKRQDTTMTAVIIEALKARFGEPPFD